MKSDFRDLRGPFNRHSFLVPKIVACDAEPPGVIQKRAWNRAAAPYADGGPTSPQQPRPRVPYSIKETAHSAADERVFAVVPIARATEEQHRGGNFNIINENRPWYHSRPSSKSSSCLAKSPAA